MTDENVGSDQDNSHQMPNHRPRTDLVFSFPFWPPVMYAFLYFYGPLAFEPIDALAMLAKILLIIFWVALGHFVFGILRLIDKDNSGWDHILSALLVALMRHGPLLDVVALLLFT